MWTSNFGTFLFWKTIIFRRFVVAVAGIILKEMEWESDSRVGDEECLIIPSF